MAEDVICIGLFRPGDVVQLRSGGPCMTVKYSAGSHDQQERFWCGWFDKSDHFHSLTFPYKALRLVERKENDPPGICQYI